MRFSLLGQAAACKQQLLVGTSFAAFASGWIRKLTCSAVPPLQSKPAALGFALAPGEGDARLRPEWRQGIRKDRAANPVFSDLKLIDAADSFRQRRSRCHLPQRGRHGGCELLPAEREAQSLRRCAPPPFTQGRHGSRPLRQLCCHLPRGGRHNPSVSLAADSSLCTREPLRRDGGASRINFQAGGGCGVLRTSDRPAEGFLRRISH